MLDKKIFGLLLVVVMLLPMQDYVYANDYDHDYKRGMLDDYSNIIHNTLPNGSYDNDNKTAGLHDYNGKRVDAVIVMRRPVDISYMYIDLEAYYGTHKLFVYVDDELVYQNGKTTKKYIKIDKKNAEKIEVVIEKYGMSGVMRLREIDFFCDGCVDDVEIDGVYDVIADDVSWHSVDVSWSDDDDNRQYEIYVDGILHAKTNKKSIKIDNLKPVTDYQIAIVAILKDKKSGVVNKKIKTAKKPVIPPKDVTDLLAVADSYNKITLKWDNPVNHSHVNIYRNDQLIAKDVDGESYTDTNKIQPSMDYLYKVVAINKERKPANGVEVDVSTPDKPPPKIDGGNYERDANGNYVYRWDEPAVGKVRVIVGGKEYATVNAQQKQIVIPADDMRYTVFDEPDVTLVPIDAEGTEGEPVVRPPMDDASNGGNKGNKNKLDINASVSVVDVIMMIVSILSMLSSLVLLGLALYYTPKIIQIIRDSVRGG